MKSIASWVYESILPGLCVIMFIMMLVLLFYRWSVHSGPKVLWTGEEREAFLADCTDGRFPSVPESVQQDFCDCSADLLSRWRPYSWLSDGRPSTEDEMARMRSIFYGCRAHAVVGLAHDGI